jgi:hypothetical protein
MSFDVHILSLPIVASRACRFGRALIGWAQPPGQKSHRAVRGKKHCPAVAVAKLVLVVTPTGVP